MPEWNIFVAVIIAIGIACRLAKWPRWRKDREEKLKDILETFPNITYRWIFWTGAMVMATELGIIALSFWYIYYLLN